MASISGAIFSSISKYKISRRGRKLQATDDQRTLVALPKDVPERTWAEVLQKEENDLFIFEIREDIVEEALRVGYERYMDRQNALFTAHCAAQAWLKLIDWHFYRHDPGEDPSAHPACFIPKRLESWIPDELPDPSPKDTWCKQELNVVEDTPEEGLQKWPSTNSLDVPVVEEIPSEYWFPGKVNVPDDMRRKREREESLGGDDDASDTTSPSEDLATESEVLQKITDYSTEELSQKDSTYSALKTTTPVDGSLHGAGDSVVDRLRTKRRHSEKSKVFSKASMIGRSRATLPPLDIGDSRSRISIISDCRLRNLRLDTQYEISSEKVDTPPGETVKRK
ncbi:uncharacterized protein LOC135078411 isoform X2 [Ostrinia nubilalis]|uniref:uncharacterized protein LOC114365964 isoform X2 n=1 Tax=Ostrinia furnacalis TaxID=93504 RepID=UPI00103FF0EF|nr:uncharacterized protein LOC114365964 isoform X2 [Ostrinia furnacalis]